MRTSVIVIACTLLGCAQQQWSKAGTSGDQFNRDNYECQQQSVSMYPPAPTQQMTSPGYQAPANQNTQTNCTAYGSQVNCQTTQQGASIYNRPATYITVDANASPRQGAHRSCLFAKGYSLK